MHRADVLQQLIAVVAIGAVASSGCGSVTQETAPAGTTTAGGGDAGGSGAMGGRGAGAAGGDGGAGAGGSSCVPPATGCAGDEKCTIVDERLGAPDGLGCAAAGPRVAFEPCDADAVCGAGLWCDYTTGVCKPLCGVGSLLCEGANDCVVGRDSAGLPIPGLGVCLARCNPVAAPMNPCADHPDTTCFYRADEAGFDCGVSGAKPWPNVCASHAECEYGLGCIGGSCRDWCPAIGAECAGTKGDGSIYCENFAPCGTCSTSGFELDGAPLGACL